MPGTELRPGVLEKRLELAFLTGIARDDILARGPEGDFPPFEKLARPGVPLDAEVCLEGILPVVDAGVEHAAVPRGGLLANPPVFFQEVDLVSPLRQVKGHVAPHHSRSYYRCRVHVQRSFFSMTVILILRLFAVKLVKRSGFIWRRSMSMNVVSSTWGGIRTSICDEVPTRPSPPHM